METPAIHPDQAAPAIFADASACGGIVHLNPTLRIAR